MNRLAFVLALTMVYYQFGNAASAAPVEIGFDNVPINVPFTGPETEDGFVYSLASGSLFGTQINSGPEIDGLPSAGGGVLEIVSETPGGIFNFVSIDIAEYDRTGDQDFPVVIQGLLNGNPVGTEQLSPLPENPDTFGAFSTASATAGGLLGDTVDQLLITLHAVPGTTVNTLYLHRANGVVVEVIPEPASLVLLGLGWGALLARRR